MPAGRPTSYKPEYCHEVVALGKEGKSPAQMAAHFDVTRQTVVNWCDEFPEFLAAFNRAAVHCQAWWEDKGMSGMEKPGFNAAVWKKSVEARFRDDYTERKDINANISISHEEALEQLE
jgi:hypothetical protein